jgi:GT2 family glycosyltransferase
MNLRPRIGILVLNRNGRQWLASIFRSLREQGYENQRFYLVDNASTDGSVEFTQFEYPEVTIIQMPRNLGFCMAYNLAMPYAFADGCDWVIWANNDVELEPGCLEELARIASADPRIGVLGPSFLDWEKDEPNDYMRGNHPYAIPAMEQGGKEPIAVDWVEGSFLMVRRSCVEAIGLLDPLLFFYWEEADFCRRARFRGWKVVLVPRALARHYAGGWSASDPQKQKAANRLQTRNFYIYKMADPSHRFLTNLFSALHLFLVNLKQKGGLNPSSILFHCKLFAGTMKEILPIYQKYVRDLQGGHPASTTEEYASIEARITGTRAGAASGSAEQSRGNAGRFPPFQSLRGKS